MLKREHLKFANQAATRRKEFRWGLVIVVILGGLFGYSISGWFLGYVPSYVITGQERTVVDGFTISPEVVAENPAAETLLVVFGLFGVIIWPAIFSVIYLLLGWWFAGKHEVEDQNRAAAAQEARAIETAQRISDAKARGDLDRWSKNK